MTSRRRCPAVLTWASHDPQSRMVEDTGSAGYLDMLATLGSVTINVPDEPIVLSYLVTASIIIDLPERQGLLAQPTALRRLRAEQALLAKETAILRSLGSTPAPDLRSSPYSEN